MTKTKEKARENEQAIEETRKKCGIVMPISAIDGCDANHWQEILSIVKDAISQADFDGELVSLSADVGVIHRRIVQNLYENPIVVCDVSGKNPNVMFELGLRLAFDKPTIIIKDDATNYSFDTSPIEHLEYPRSLRFNQIIEFKEELKNKILATYKKSSEDVNYSPFLKHFGNFTVANIDSTEVSAQEFLISQIEDIKNLIIKKNFDDKNISRPDSYINLPSQRKVSYSMRFHDLDKAKNFYDNALNSPGVDRANMKYLGSEAVVDLKLSPDLSDDKRKKLIEILLGGQADENL